MERKRNLPMVKLPMVKLPIAIENFERVRKDGFYYVDKTRMIRDLLENIALVNLFTRPRRFGKTLNMSMLKYFFENGTDRMLFDGLDISREKELCGTFMGKFPVISITINFLAASCEVFAPASPSLLRSKLRGIRPSF